jgi:protein-tyrosine phosphatase
MIRHILIVCVGNICRSPMAEAVLRNELRGQDQLTVESAGLGALVGEPASQHAMVLMEERGIDISSHRAQQLTPELVRKADLILVMESRHKKAIESDDPATRGKVFRLGEWLNQEIADPHRLPRQAFEEALAGIDECVADWVERLKG